MIDLRTKPSWNSLALGEVESRGTTHTMRVGGWTVPYSALRWKTECEWSERMFFFYAALT